MYDISSLASKLKELERRIEMLEKRKIPAKIDDTSEQNDDDDGTPNG